MHLPPILELFATVLALAQPPSALATPAVDGGQATSETSPPPWAKDVEHLVSQALAEAKLPGCVVAAGRRSGVVYLKAFGARALLPAREPMTADTIFDLASLTKPLATAAALMVLA